MRHPTLTLLLTSSANLAEEMTSQPKSKAKAGWHSHGSSSAHTLVTPKNHMRAASIETAKERKLTENTQQVMYRVSD